MLGFEHLMLINIYLMNFMLLTTRLLYTMNGTTHNPATFPLMQLRLTLSIQGTNTEQ